MAAVDFSDEALNNSAHLCEKTIKLDVANEKLTIEDNEFDIVISFMVLEHIVNPELFISEVIRVCKPGGMILITIPNIVSFISRIRVLFGYLPLAVSSDKTHVKYYTERELSKLFSTHDLTPDIIPTSFSINPLKQKGFRIPSNIAFKSLDDHILIKINVTK